MLTIRKEKYGQTRGPFRIKDKDIIDRGLDYPYALEQDWDVYRLGRKEEHLFLADLTDPIALTAVNTTYIYEMPFDMTLTKLVFYQRDAALAESDDIVNIRVDFSHPNKTPEVIYYKNGISWPTGGTRITGKTYMPAGDLRIIVDGTATNLLYVSIEFEVHNIA